MLRGIEPMEEGLDQVTDIAESAADARHYLVNRLTKQVTVTVEGKPRQMRIVSEHDFFLPRDPGWTSDIERLIVLIIAAVSGVLSAVNWMADEVDHIWLRVVIISPVLVILLVLMWFVDRGQHKVNKEGTKHEGE